jgi:hypothetical protein
MRYRSDFAMATRVGMHQTTIRFSPDIWARLEDAAREAGVSAAHYVREAVVARLAYADAQRVRAPGLADPRASHFLSDRGVPTSAAVRAASMTVRTDAEAVWAQAQRARARAQELRQSSNSVQSRARAQRRTSGWRQADSRS